MPLDICYSAQNVLKAMSLQDAWLHVKRPDWGLWLLGRVDVDRTLLTRCVLELLEYPVKACADQKMITMWYESMVNKAHGRDYDPNMCDEYVMKRLRRPLSMATAHARFGLWLLERQNWDHMWTISSHVVRGYGCNYPTQCSIIRKYFPVCPVETI